MTDVFKLSTRELSKQGVKMNLLSPDTGANLTAPTSADDPTPRQMYLTIYGPASPQIRRFSKRIQQRIDNDDDHEELTDEECEELDKEDARMLAKLTKDGLVFGKDKWWEPEEMDEAFLYNLFYTVPDFGAQVFKYLKKPGNFIRK